MIHLLPDIVNIKMKKKGKEDEVTRARKRTRIYVQ